ncbi:MAG: hypothetical protein VXZ72_03905, partial [Chlamydiota bacterium]|nr:hypothetical protein [Chlamydiota bacterium]
MSQTKGEDFVRLEHKLDAILVYLKRLTGEPPSPMPKMVPGLGGMTDGSCPITGSPIYFKVDPKSGKVIREDALTTGVVDSGSIITPP